MNQCYECKWRRDTPGSAHSKCVHPSMERVAEDPLGNVLAIMASVGRAPPTAITSKALNIKADPYGVGKGWFNFPWDFDPVWLISCDGLTEKAPAQESGG